MQINIIQNIIFLLIVILNIFLILYQCYELKSRSKLIIVFKYSVYFYLQFLASVFLAITSQRIFPELKISFLIKEH